MRNHISWFNLLSRGVLRIYFIHPLLPWLTPTLTEWHRFVQQKTTLSASPPPLERGSWTDAEAETPILWPPHAKSWLIGKDPDAGRYWGLEEKAMIGWDGWMASPTQWTWVWVNSRSWWWTGRPGMLQFMGSQSRTRLSDWTELNWTEPDFVEYVDPPNTPASVPVVAPICYI